MKNYLVSERMMQLITQLILVLIVLFFLFSSAGAAEARYRSEVSGWIPYWTDEDGVEAVIDNLGDIDILYLFVYQVDAEGELVLKVDLEDAVWKKLIKIARRKDVLLMPTIAWFDGDAIHETLSSRKKMRAHVRAIEEMVDDMRFDGVNIDYEQKKAETIDYFSDFLNELEDELGRDDLSCTIEARTPPTSRWKVVPEKIEWANDYKAMNKYCDWVEIMTYDQMRADLNLNKERRGVPYMPVADIDWVEKVLTYALQDIDADKIMLGIPTYGRAWDVTVAPQWYRDYDKVATLNYSRILELAKKYNAPIGRSAGGEGVISYFPEGSTWELLNALPTPEDTPKGFEAAAKALMVATYANVEIPVRFVSWSDAESVEDKLDLIEEYDLKGAAFFSFNGEEDENIWDLF
tara:strand:+ start:2335 stop:3552 length:1218 start_codon:yes stop_codon:yes gene_type:complete